ncbi:MAG: hypothetical protein EP343_30475 [Deltaproteobacteria bacterium]|nr:MAG: hypothetical protein EP343_30475 [Deltaproteobacteria bacterium]
MRKHFVFWTLAVACVATLFLIQLRSGLPIETDITALLPNEQLHPVEQKARKAFSQKAGRQVLFLVGHTSFSKARRAATTLRQHLVRSEVFAQLELKASGQQATRSLYFPHREHLLAQDVVRSLSNPTSGPAFLQNTTKLLYHPLYGAFARNLKQDPLLLYPRWLQELASRAGPVEVRDGVRVVKLHQRSYLFLTGTLKQSPYHRTTQKKLNQHLAQAQQSIRAQAQGVDVRFAGMIRFASYSASSSEREFSRIGVGTIVGIVLLLLLTFGSLRHLLVAGLPIAVGLLFAMTALFAVYTRVHVLTLVFGGSLIGVCVDYAFHYFAEHSLAEPSAPAEASLSVILPGILLGALTSILGYMALFLAPFPGLKQMAVFSSVGLLGALGTVIFWFPLLMGRRRSQQPPRTLRVSNLLLTLWDQPRYRSVLWVLLLACAGTAIYGMYQLETRDDIRLLYHQPKTMRDDYQQIQQATGNVGVSRFFLVQGKTPEQVLQREEQLRTKLKKELQQGRLRRVLAVSQFVPSQATQKRHQALLVRRVVKPGHLRRWMKGMGFADKLILRTEQRLQAQPKPLTLQGWQQSSFSKPLRYLWLGSTKSGHASMVLLGGVTDSQRLAKIASQALEVRYVDNVATVSGIFRTYRRRIAGLLLGVYVLILLLLGWRYGWDAGLRIVLVLAVTTGLALGGLGLLGQSIDMFSMLALLLVLGIGIDYTIFFAEGRTEQEGTMLAVLLSACTTILSFGILALSTTPMLRTFGLTLFLGMVFAMLLSPLARPKKEHPTTHPESKELER